MDNISYLKNSFEACNIVLSEQQIEKFMAYYALLVEKNKVMNLTAITDFEEVVIKHFVDSVSLLTYTSLDISEKKIIDVGTGAGFPGIPLKIVLGDSCNITLLDSLNKRILFLDDVIRQLDLKNIQTVHARAEDAGKNPLFREQFDFCVSRAVANLSTLAEYDLPFVKIGGKLICYKSLAAGEELKNAKQALYLLGGKIDERTGMIDFTLPNSELSRTILMIDKVNGTPKKYPRKAGLPSKEPL